jgi:AcrR family transcriptional regulator
MTSTAEPPDRAMPAGQRVRKPHAGTIERREAILRAAMEVFGTRGYNKGVLAEVAEKANMTHAGVLHHFGSKEGLLVAMLKYRDGDEVAGIPERPRIYGLPLLDALVKTVEENTHRRGVVQTFAVLSGESVADGHPAQDYFRERTRVLRNKLADALDEATDGAATRAQLLDAASAFIAVMDGLQMQWLLDPDAVDMPRIVKTTLDEIVDRLRNGAPSDEA